MVATTEAALDEEWSPAPTTAFKVGDALIRTITRTAADVPAMAMLDLAFPVAAGCGSMSIHHGTTDSQNRGELVGRRTDRVTYVFEAPGTIELPAVTQPWWDLRAGRLREAKGTGARIAIAAITQAPDGRRRAAIAIGLAVFLLGMGWWLAPRAVAVWKRRQRRWQQSEAKAFRDLDRACRRGDTPAIYRAFLIWRQRTTQPRALASLAEELEQVLYGSDRPRTWSDAEARNFCKEARDARRALEHAHNTAGYGDLPPLNPLRGNNGGVDERRFAAR